MAVRTLEFEDLHQPWKLTRTEFGNFNLLVGLSGVGKTRTLRVLQSIGRAASGDDSHGFRHCRWTIEVETADGLFSWTAETAADTSAVDVIELDDDSLRFSPTKNARFAFEEIKQGNGEVVAHRDEKRLFLKDREYPKLRPTDSIISLFDEEPISTIRNALSAIQFSKAPLDRYSRPFDIRKLTKLIRETKSFDALKMNRSLDLMSKAYILANKNSFSEYFEPVKEQMREIFDSVEEIAIGPTRAFSDPAPSGPLDLLVPAFRERGVEGWIYGNNISAGMLRTLKHILELHLEPPGSVLLLDEYENGMGANCLSQVTELIVGRASDFQLIFTSHHPFVIETIPKESWMVMQRQGYEVSVLRTHDIARLNTASNQDAFVQLVNVPEYMHGLQ